MPTPSTLIRWIVVPEEAQVVPWFKNVGVSFKATLLDKFGAVGQIKKSLLPRMTEVSCSRITRGLNHGPDQKQNDLMKVDVFTLCEFAKAERGKMTIVNAFNRIVAKQAPVVYPLCALAAIMRFERIEEGEKHVRVSIIDSDGKPVMPTLQAQINIQLRPNESDATVHFALLIQQIKLPNFGEYSIDLAIDGRQEASTPLYVREFRPLQPPTQLP